MNTGIQPTAHSVNPRCFPTLHAHIPTSFWRPRTLRNLPFPTRHSQVEALANMLSAVRSATASPGAAGGGSGT